MPNHDKQVNLQMIEAARNAELEGDVIKKELMPEAGDLAVYKTLTFHPAVAGVLDFFEFDHLPEYLQDVSRDFYDLALRTAMRAPNDQETTIALRKLLEAKDAAVRAVIRGRKQADQAMDKLRGEVAKPGVAATQKG